MWFDCGCVVCLFCCLTLVLVLGFCLWLLWGLLSLGVLFCFGDFCLCGFPICRSSFSFAVCLPVCVLCVWVCRYSLLRHRGLDFQFFVCFLDEWFGCLTCGFWVC